MKRDEDKTREELLLELVELRRQVSRLGSIGAPECALPRVGISNGREGRSEDEIEAEALSRVSREIHSGVAQDIAAVHMRMSIWHHLVDEDPQQMHAEIAVLKEQLEEGIRRLKQLIFILRPLTISNDDEFYTAIHTFTEDFADQFLLKVDLAIEGSRLDLSAANQRLLFHILREILHNVGRHAEADSVQIVLEVEPSDRATLSVRDDGIGFDPGILDDTPNNRCLGLKRLRARVNEVGGDFVLRSRPGGGTEVRVALPLSEQG